MRTKSPGCEPGGDKPNQNHIPIKTGREVDDGRCRGLQSLGDVTDRTDEQSSSQEGQRTTNKNVPGGQERSHPYLTLRSTTSEGTEYVPMFPHCQSETGGVFEIPAPDRVALEHSL